MRGDKNKQKWVMRCNEWDTINLVMRETCKYWYVNVDCPVRRQWRVKASFTPTSTCQCDLPTPCRSDVTARAHFIHAPGRALHIYRQVQKSLWAVHHLEDIKVNYRSCKLLIVFEYLGYHHLCILLTRPSKQRRIIKIIICCSNRAVKNESNLAYRKFAVVVFLTFWQKHLL